MGYSCSTLASNSQNAMLVELQREVKTPLDSSNSWMFKGNEYFVERGREQRDGSITGTVMRMGNNINGIKTGYSRKAGSIKILYNGEIKSWPFSTKSMREKAMKVGRARFTEIYGEDETQRQIAS